MPTRKHFIGVSRAYLYSHYSEHSDEGKVSPPSLPLSIPEAVIVQVDDYSQETSSKNLALSRTNSMTSMEANLTIESSPDTYSPQTKPLNKEPHRNMTGLIGRCQDAGEDKTADTYSSLPEEQPVRGKEARRHSSERLSSMVDYEVEPSVNTLRGCRMRLTALGRAYCSKCSYNGRCQ